ncbi:hypothetical protein [Burkholderia ambifaria]
MLVATVILDEPGTITKTHFLSEDIFAECDGLRVVLTPSRATAVVDARGCDRHDAAQ